MKSWLEISRARLAANFRATREAAGSDAETLAVIKADAYGHGAALCAPILTQAGARWLGVTDIAEAATVRCTLGETDTRIVPMCGMEPGDATAVLAHRLTPVLWTPAHLAALERAAQSARQPVSFHLEVDTGMARQGIVPGPALDALLHRLAHSPWLVCEGVMTHLCCAEVTGAATTSTATQRFADALRQVAAAGLSPSFVHVANTSAVDDGSTLAFVRQQAALLGARPMVRTGLALYGYCLPLEGAGPTVPHLRPNVHPVLTWKASVLDVRDIPAGATVGYGATFTAPRPLRLALFQAGYADGFRREASSGLGNGWVLVQGRRAPVVGRVSMNLTVVDVTGVQNLAPGDELILLGEGVTAEDHARWAGTLPYDILCGLRPPRVLV